MELNAVKCSGLMNNYFATNFILDPQKVPGLR